MSDKDYVKGDEFEKKLFDNELKHILGRKDVRDKVAEIRVSENIGSDVDDWEVLKKHLFGLAFSGGGIRSATFSLGVMQALAEKGWLERFHYLSTVSGGGYIGSALTWFLERPLSKEKKLDEKINKSWLRYIPFISAISKVGSVASALAWKYDIRENNERDFNVGDKFPFQRDSKGQSEHSRMLLRHLRQDGKYLTPGHGITWASLIAVILRGALLSLLTLGIPLVLIVATLIHFCWLPPFNGNYLDNGFVVTSLSLLAFFAVASIGYGMLSRNISSYQWRRWFEKWMGRVLWMSALTFVIGSLPIVYHYLTCTDMIGEITSGVTFTGVAGAIFSIIKSQNKEEGILPLGFVAPVAITLLVFGLLLLAYWGAFIHNDSIWQWKWYAISTVVALGTLVNINYISIHRYYRDRLMELYLPNKQAGEFCNVEATESNEAPLSEMCDFPKATGPYHLINANMLTINSEDSKLKQRGGDNFILSPLYCGSKATGWKRTSDYMGDNMKLATAMAISGAAADPHGAPGGEGLTRNRSLSLLMSLFNVRLGYWAKNPNPPRLRTWFNSPNWFIHILKEFLGKKLNETGSHVHLADGGHFENLAVYELIRRKVKTIVVCDGAADPGYAFADLGNLIEKVRVDFGVDIDMPSLLEVSPKPDLDKNGSLKYPNAIETAKQGYSVGTIYYGSDFTGKLIYVKTTMIEHLPKDLYCYKSDHPSFPDETTADQFFDEKQFEAYRELGYRIGVQMIDNLKADHLSGTEKGAVIKANNKFDDWDRDDINI